MPETIEQLVSVADLLDATNPEWRTECEEVPTYLPQLVLPDGATGIYWTWHKWTECRLHLEDPSWIGAVIGDVDTDRREGRLLYGDDVECDLCSEFGEAYDLDA